MPNSIAAEVIRLILRDLTDRRGLRQEWEQIDDEIQAEIISSWEKLVASQVDHVITERDQIRARLADLNNAAADLVAEAVGPYDPPQPGSRLERLYLLVTRP